VLDTSGSMSDWIAKAATHVYSLVEYTKSVRFLSCDSAVHSIEDIRTAEELLAAIKGGGGTDMRPAFDELRSGRDFSPDVTICVTDGEIGDPGPEPPWEHIWVCNNTDFRSPWGKVIYVEHEGN
jgi:predicted metal-dependent peptidase